LPPASTPPLIPSGQVSEGEAPATNLLPPKGQLSGVIHLDGRAINANQPLRLLVTLGGESHEIVFDVKLSWKSYK